MPLLSLIRARPAAAPQGDADEAALLHRIALGERAAMESLYRGYHRRLDRFLARLTRRADVVEEVINDTFWIVWQKAGEFRGDSRVSTWILGIAWRCALKTLREHGDEPTEPADAASAADALHALDDPHARHELADWVAKGMRRLTAEQRATMELAYGAGHSLDEVAQIMDCELSTVKARMFHARAKLRQVLPMLAGMPAVRHSGRAGRQENDDEA
ncbi:sigma-70 family RNA polymerase sigma factor [Rhizobacter sp. SG703]|uniref:sigma-70 family RNA polymerase sigma factor n=1 Tax=Rhizobacter sp. SG703 TaxID=2587140 RepID=UPI0014467DE3|nr:sigma-70 family RNA polymerase sigma factor [Rhizobacter sp. SG703]NKI96350.1 RNA polymerase sigma-70 factor (ECF subfamily) [Rhizobacter sp. SG703]